MYYALHVQNSLAALKVSIVRRPMFVHELNSGGLGLGQQVIMILPK